MTIPLPDCSTCQTPFTPRRSMARYCSPHSLLVAHRDVLPEVSRGVESQKTAGPIAGLVGIEGGVVSGVFNLESSGVEASDGRPRHDEHYHEA